jgi:hypothetical protein
LLGIDHRYRGRHIALIDALLADGYRDLAAPRWRIASARIFGLSLNARSAT